METVVDKQVKGQGDKAMATEKNSFLRKELPCLELYGMTMEKGKDDLRAQLQVLEEIKSVLDEQYRLLNEALLECQKLKTDTENGQLKEQVKYFQENDDGLLKENEFFHHALARLQNQTVRIGKQNANLCAVAKVLKKNVIIINESTENLISDLYQIETQSDKNQTEIHRLRTELQTVRSMLQDQDDLIRRMDEAETLMKSGFVENKNLSNKLLDLDENNTFLKKQNEMIRDELEKNKSVQTQQSQQIAHLRSALKDHELSSEQVQFLLYSKDHMIEKQKREIAYQREVTEELNTLVTSLRQIIRDLQSQLEQMEELFVTKKCNECLLKKAHIGEPFDSAKFELETNTEGKDFKEELKDPQHDIPREQNRLFNLTTVLFESPSFKMETENEDLKAHVKVLEVTKNSLMDKIKSLSDEVALLTCRCEKMETKEEELRTQVKVLGHKCTLDDKNTFPDVLADVENHSVRIDKQNETLVTQENILTKKDMKNKSRGTWLADSSHAESQRDTNQREMYCRRMEAQSLKAELKDQNDIIRGMDDEEKGWAENEKLWSKLHGLENSNVLKEDAMVSEELEEYRSAQNQQNQKTTRMKTSSGDPEWTSDEVRFSLICQDDILILQEREIADQQEVTEDIDTPNTTLIQNIHQELCLFDKARETETFDDGQLEAKMKTDKKDSRAQINDPQRHKDTPIEPRLSLQIDADNENLKTHQENKSVKYHEVKAEAELREDNENRKNRYETTQTLNDSLVCRHFQEDHYDTDTYHLSTEAQRLNSALQECHDLTLCMHDSKSFMEKTWTENERVRNKLHGLYKQNKIVREQLEEYTSLREQQFSNLKIVIIDPKFPIDKEQYQYYFENEQKREQVYQHEITLMKHLMIRLRQTNLDLEGQFGPSIKDKTFAAVWRKTPDDPVHWFLGEPRTKEDPADEGLLYLGTEEDSVDEGLLETESEEDSVDAILLDPRTKGDSLDDGPLQIETKEHSVDEGLLKTDTEKVYVDAVILETRNEKDLVDVDAPETENKDSLDGVRLVPRTEEGPVDEGLTEPTTEEDPFDEGFLETETAEDPVLEGRLEPETEEESIYAVLLQPRTKGEPKAEGDPVDKDLLAPKTLGVPVDEGLLVLTTAENPLDEGILRTATYKDPVNMGLIETADVSFDMGSRDTEDGPVDMGHTEPPKVEAYFEDYLKKPKMGVALLEKGLIETATEDNPVDVVLSETEGDLVSTGLIVSSTEEDLLYECLREPTAKTHVHEVLLKDHQVRTTSVCSRCVKKVMSGAKRCFFALVILGVLISGAFVALKIGSTFFELCECLDPFKNYLENVVF